MRKISVIVPVYNVEKYLDRCVQSICNQTYKNMEIILVDDGSTDSSADMCDAYAKGDDRIQVVHKRNGGLSDARNVGLRHATGEYIYFCDSDDYIELYLLEECITHMEQDGLDILIFAFYRLQDGITTVCREKLPTGVFSMKGTPSLLFSSPSACNKMFRTDFLQKNQFQFPVGYFYEDLGSVPKLYLLADKIKYVDIPYYYYEIREGSIMTETKIEKAFQHRIEMVECILDYYEERGFGKQYIKELEFFAFYNGLFLPIRENALKGCTKKDCNRYRDAIFSRYPNCFSNNYICSMGQKDKLFVQILKCEQYWMFGVLSKLKRIIKGR